MHAVSYACSRNHSYFHCQFLCSHKISFHSIIYNTYQLIWHPRQPRQDQQRPTPPSHRAKRKSLSRTTRPRRIRKRLQPRRKSLTPSESAGESYARIYAPDYGAILNFLIPPPVFVILINSLQEGIRFSEETWLRSVI